MEGWPNGFWVYYTLVDLNKPNLMAMLWSSKGVFFFFFSDKKNINMNLGILNKYQFYIILAIIV